LGVSSNISVLHRVITSIMLTFMGGAAELNKVSVAY
jgi:hypothetical protein